MSKAPTLASVNGTTLSGAQQKAFNVGLIAALNSAGLQEGNRTTITSDTTLTVTQCGLLLVDCTGGNVALTLPTSGTTTDDAVYNISRLDSTGNTLTVSRGGSDTIEGSSSAVSIEGRGILGLQLPAGGTDWKVSNRSGGTQTGARNAIGLGAGADIVSASTLDLSNGPRVRRVTGTNTTTAFTLDKSGPCLVTADGAWPINVSGVLVYTCNPEDSVLLWQDGDGVQHAIPMLSASIARAGAAGAHKNLKVDARGINNASVVVTADSIVLEDGNGNFMTVRSVNHTINSASSGANGLDTGSLAADTWYSVWEIAKADGTKAGLLSLSSTAPTMPTDYTYKARVGKVRTDSTGNKYLLQTTQYGRKARYVVTAATNTAALPAMASGASGSPVTPTWTPVAAGAFVPTDTASHIELVLSLPNAGAGAAIVIAAPNNAYGAFNSASNPPPLCGNTYTNSSSISVMGNFMLESTNVYYAATGTGVGLYCAGWEDNL